MFHCHILSGTMTRMAPPDPKHLEAPKRSVEAVSYVALSRTPLSNIETILDDSELDDLAHPTRVDSRKLSTYLRPKPCL